MLIQECVWMVVREMDFEEGVQPLMVIVAMMVAFLFELELLIQGGVK